MLRHPTTDHALLISIIMAEKKPYTINTMSDGITSLNIAGLTEMFKTRQTLLSFAIELEGQVSERRVGVFHLQENLFEHPIPENNLIYHILFYSLLFSKQNFFAILQISIAASDAG